MLSEKSLWDVILERDGLSDLDKLYGYCKEFRIYSGHGRLVDMIDAFKENCKCVPHNIVFYTEDQIEDLESMFF